MAPDLDRRAGDLEAVLGAPRRQAFLDRVVGELVDAAARVADGESGPAMIVMMMGMGAGDEGIDAFKPVDGTCLEQLFESAVDLQRRPQAFVAQTVEDCVGRQRLASFFQRIEDQGLVAGEFAGSAHRR